MGKIMGQKEYEKWKNKQKLTLKHSVLGHCYTCNGFEDSNNDCLSENTCVLYPYSPHGRKKANRSL
jgi:hypothetical protein